MATLGYALSSEEHRPGDLVRYARLAEEAGFPFALISDHYHPWVDRQGQAPFVWGVLGGIAQATGRLRVGTGVTCPTTRLHPAIVAQAAATAAALLPGRFFLGVGTGENLNEHILGDRWPPHDLRLARLEEAVAVIRLLWRGGVQTHRGEHYTVEHARVYTLPDEPVPIMVAAGGPHAAEVAGRIGDGLIGTAPDAVLDRAKAALSLATDRPHALREAIQACRKGGTVSIPGVYGGLLDKVPMGAAFGKGLTFRMGQTHVMRYLQPLLEKIADGAIDPTFIITHRRKLDDAPAAYETFKAREDGCIKVVLTP